MKLRVWTSTAIFMVALHASAFAVEGGTLEKSVIGGTLTGFLKKDNSPYLVNETIVVPEGKALVVEAGTALYFSEGTGLDVRGGSVAIMGEKGNTVTMTSAEDGKLWNGITVTGVKRSEIQGTHIENAMFGIAVESGSLDVRDGVISNAGRAGVFVRNGSVALQWTRVEDCINVGVWATHSAEIDIDASTLSGNHVALFAGENSTVNLMRTQIDVNEVGIVDLGNNVLTQRNSTVENNEVAFVAEDIPPQDIRPALEDNSKLFARNASEYKNDLGEEPVNPYADAAKYAGNMKESQDSSWSISGNVGIELGYHKVLTRHNSSAEDYISQDDTIKPGERYINYFQVPGFFTNWNANLLLK